MSIYNSFDISQQNADNIALGKLATVTSCAMLQCKTRPTAYLYFT